MSLKFNVLSVEDGQKEMETIDAYMEHTTPWYRQKFSNGTLENFAKVMGESVVPAPEDKVEIINSSERILNSALEKMGMDINEEISFIFTDGTDNIGLPYTKGTAMICPVDYNYPGPLNHLNPHLIIHEIWHILSRKYPELRKSTYQAIGFKESKQGGLPVEQIDDYFINPDAISHDYYFPMYDEDGNEEEYETFAAIAGGTYPFLIKVKDGEIIEKEFVNKNLTFVKAFRNVGYLSHAEEICAEHFRLRVMSLVNPDMVIKDQELMDKFTNNVVNFFEKQHAKLMA